MLAPGAGGADAAKLLVVVDDEPDIALMVTAALAPHGIEVRSITEHFERACHIETWIGVRWGLIDVLLRDPITGMDVLAWMKKWVPSVERISYSAVITLHPRLAELADTVVLKGDLGELLHALGLA